MTEIFALGGDAHRAPSDTLVSYWAALAARADGLALQVRADGTDLVCAPLNLPLQNLSALDAGANFTAIELENMREVRQSDTRPWRAAANGSNALRYPRLRDVLRTFGRRTSICLCLPDDAEHWLGLLLDTLDQFGLKERVRLELSAASGIKLRDKLRAVYWAARLEELGAVSLSSLHEFGARAISLSGRAASDLSKLTEEAKRYQLALWLRPDAASLAPSLEHGQLRAPVDVVLTRAADATLAHLNPGSVVFADALRTTALDTSQWAGGYSHPNTETALEPRGDGFHILMRRGVEYSGGGIVTLFPVHRAFDARVEFRVTNAQQATTFELAAIGIDPGYTELNARQLTSKSVNLTFDVHGAPPYASSERDEDNGYRLGWNNSSNLTQILDDWSHSSANMYNKYGRDVGSDGVQTGPGRGALRLIRNGPVFASLYQDEATREWVCSGAGLVSALPEDVFIRLAAKHWAKTGEPPANEVIFSNFELRQI